MGISASTNPAGTGKSDRSRRGYVLRGRRWGKREANSKTKLLRSNSRTVCCRTGGGGPLAGDCGSGTHGRGVSAGFVITVRTGHRCERHRERRWRLRTNLGVTLGSPQSPLRGSRPWTRGNHDVRWHLLAARLALLSLQLESRSDPWSKRIGVNRGMKIIRTIKLEDSRTHRTFLDMIPPNAHRLFSIKHSHVTLTFFFCPDRHR